jgi:hypothetical protein
MKFFLKDVLLTLAVKLLLLYLLWFICVKNVPSHWSSSQDWFLSHSFQSQNDLTTNNNRCENDKQRSR